MDWINQLLAAAAIVGGIGYATGQFFSSRRKGVSDALKTALDEIEANKIRADRLAGVAAEKTTELAEVRLENQSLRNAFTSGAVVAPQILKAIQDALEEAKKLMHEEHEKTRRVIQDGFR